MADEFERKLDAFTLAVRVERNRQQNRIDEYSMLVTAISQTLERPFPLSVMKNHIKGLINDFQQL